MKISVWEYLGKDHQRSENCSRELTSWTDTDRRSSAIFAKAFSKTCFAIYTLAWKDLAEFSKIQRPRQFQPPGFLQLPGYGFNRFCGFNGFMVLFSQFSFCNRSPPRTPFPWPSRRCEQLCQLCVIFFLPCLLCTCLRFWDFILPFVDFARLILSDCLIAISKDADAADADAADSAAGAMLCYAMLGCLCIIHVFFGYNQNMKDPLWELFCWGGLRPSISIRGWMVGDQIIKEWRENVPGFWSQVLAPVRCKHVRAHWHLWGFLTPLRPRSAYGIQLSVVSTSVQIFSLSCLMFISILLGHKVHSVSLQSSQSFEKLWIDLKLKKELDSYADAFTDPYTWVIDLAGDVCSAGMGVGKAVWCTSDLDLIPCTTTKRFWHRIFFHSTVDVLCMFCATFIFVVGISQFSLTVLNVWLSLGATASIMC